MPKLFIEIPFLPQPKRIDAYLAEALGGQHSRQEIKQCLLRGEILLNRKPARPKSLVKGGDRIEGTLSFMERETALIPETIPLGIIYEDEHLLVVDKPAGMVVHPGAGNKKGTLVHALLGRNSSLSNLGGVQRPGIVHRLDKETSGLLLVAKTNEAHRKLQSQFEARALSKTYTTLVKGVVEFEEGRVSEPVGRHPYLRRKMAVLGKARGKEAATLYRVKKRFPRSTLLEIRTLTGRTHQIRVHMAHIGHPVIGDVLYGSMDCATRLMLHASKIEFSHPKTGKMLSFESELPADFKEVLRKAAQGVD